MANNEYEDDDWTIDDLFEIDITDSSDIITITGGNTTNGHGSIYNSSAGTITIDTPSINRDVTIDIDGKTHSIKDLVKTVDAINERLGVLVPDPDLLEEHEILQELYEQYKVTEALLKSKMKKKEK